MNFPKLISSPRRKKFLKKEQLVIRHVPKLTAAAVSTGGPPNFINCQLAQCGKFRGIFANSHSLFPKVCTCFSYLQVVYLLQLFSHCGPQTSGGPQTISRVTQGKNPLNNNNTKMLFIFSIIMTSALIILKQLC